MLEIGRKLAMKATKASVNHMNGKPGFKGMRKRLLQNENKELVEACAGIKIVVRKNLVKLVKIARTSFLVLSASIRAVI